MSETRTIAFTKMNGLGNDFVIIDARDNALSLSGDDVRALAARAHAQTQGCDQLLVIHSPRNSGDVFMQIFNADGGEVEACGNGTRAVAAYLAHKGMAAVKIETLGGILACTATLADRQASAQVSMTLPQIGAPISLHQDLPAALPVNIGNPHAVIFVATGTAGLAAQYGFQLERHKAFPERANINFASLQAALTKMSGGMAVALYTTLAGLVANLLLRVQFQLLADAMQALLLDLSKAAPNKDKAASRR